MIINVASSDNDDVAVRFTGGHIPLYRKLGGGGFLRGSHVEISTAPNGIKRSFSLYTLFAPVCMCVIRFCVCLSLIFAFHDAEENILLYIIRKTRDPHTHTHASFIFFKYIYYKLLLYGLVMLSIDCMAPRAAMGNLHIGV